MNWISFEDEIPDFDRPILAKCTLEYKNGQFSTETDVTTIYMIGYNECYKPDLSMTWLCDTLYDYQKVKNPCYTLKHTHWVHID
jgi:hypothetical protein